MTSKIGNPSLANYINDLHANTEANFQLKGAEGLSKHLNGKKFSGSDDAVKACVKSMLQTLESEVQKKTSPLNDRISLVKETSTAMANLKRFWDASKGRGKAVYGEKFKKEMDKVRKWESDLQKTLEACQRAQARQGTVAPSPTKLPTSDQASKASSQPAAAPSPKAQSIQSPAPAPNILPATGLENRDELSRSAAYMLNGVRLSPKLQEALNGGSIASGYQVEIEVLESYLKANPADSRQISPLIEELRAACDRASRLTTLDQSGVNKMAQAIGKDIKQLQINQSLVVPGGYINAKGGHAVAYKVTRDTDNSYSFTVINTGEGAEKHRKVDANKVKDLRYAGFKADSISKFGFWTDLVGYRAGIGVKNGRAVSVSYESMDPVYKTIEDHAKVSGIEYPDHQNAAERKLQSQGNCFFKCVAGYVDSRLSEELKAKVKVHGTAMHITQMEALKAPSEMIAKAKEVQEKRQNKLVKLESKGSQASENEPILGGRDVEKIKPGFFTSLMTRIMNFFKNLFRSKDKEI